MERDLATRVDRYLRQEGTVIAKILKTISPAFGTEYRRSKFKHTAEVLIATPLALTTLPIMGALTIAKKLEDGGSAFYVQKRVDEKGKSVPVIKIRCMRMDADSDLWANLKNAAEYGEENDPRNTRLGSLMRKYELEELPQLWQVIGGQISLVEIRAAPQYVMDYMQDRNPINYPLWQEGYFLGKPGLFSLNSAVNPKRKDDAKRHHYDLLYARKATLGLDLFILYRTGMRMLQKLGQKLSYG